MKDVSLKEQKAKFTNERIVNKIQDLVWDPVFAKYIGHPRYLRLNLSHARYLIIRT